MDGPVSPVSVDEWADLPPIRRILTQSLGLPLTPEVAAAIEDAANRAPKPSIDDCIAEALRHDADAIAFFFAIRDTLHFWDDLIDRDQPVSPEHIHRSMFTALVKLPSNPFFRKHQDSLLPVLINAIGNWRAANEFEARGDAKELEVAFIIRSDYANLLVQCAYLVGGHDWMVKVTPIIRSLWTSETMSDYLKNLEAERNARG